MDYHLIKKIEQININSNTNAIITINKSYFYKFECRTFEYFIECGFINLINAKITKIAFPSETALDNAIEFIKHNPSFELDDLSKFTIAN